MLSSIRDCTRRVRTNTHALHRFLMEEFLLTMDPKRVLREDNATMDSISQVVEKMNSQVKTLEHRLRHVGKNLELNQKFLLYLSKELSESAKDDKEPIPADPFPPRMAESGLVRICLLMSSLSTKRSPSSGSDVTPIDYGLYERSPIIPRRLTFIPILSFTRSH
nr:unnamed protein product [Haemonchus contortus]